jgi:predicted metallo-beta-lactamase superfamily hydrolase
MNRRDLRRLKIVPLAFDRFGVRSMATYVETDDLKIPIDPAVSLGSRRHSLSQHPLETTRMKETWADVKKYASRCDLLIVTYYHYDHNNPEEPKPYKDKMIYIKDHMKI